MGIHDLEGVQRANVDLTKNSDQGGSVRVTIPATPFKYQAGDGTTEGASRPCLECWILADSGNTSPIRVNIGSACTATTGIEVPKDVLHAQHGSSKPLRIPVRNLNLLYFIGATENDTVDILWRN